MSSTELATPVTGQTTSTPPSKLAADTATALSVPPASRTPSATVGRSASRRHPLPALISHLSDPHITEAQITTVTPIPLSVAGGAGDQLFCAAVDSITRLPRVGGMHPMSEGINSTGSVQTLQQPPEFNITVW
jgi:hypothetical protein